MMTTEQRKIDDVSKSILEEFVQEFTASISNQLNEIEKENAKLKKDLEQAIDRFEKGKDKYGASVSYSPCDVISLNIGGNKSLTVLRSTLTSVPDSMLASRFSGRWDDSLEKDKDGNFFIDEPFEIFEPMINHLRMRARETPCSKPTLSPTESWFGQGESAMTKFNGFKAMVDYYGMTSEVFPTELIVVKEGAKLPGLEVNNDICKIFELHPRGHQRKIMTFEVTLEDIETFQIGLIDYSDRTPMSLSDHRSSFALVLDQKCFFQHRCGDTEIEVKLDGICIKKGSVVRCDREKRIWTVDGEKLKTPDIYIDPSCIPAFSGIGKWKVSKVEFKP